MAEPARTKNPRGAGRKCTICRHENRDEIDRRIVAGTEIAAIARDFAVTTDAASRHKARHMPRAALQEAAEAGAASEAERGSGLLAGASELRDKALSLLRQAEEAGDLKTALLGVREATRCLELMAKLAGQIDPGATINVTFAPQFLLLQRSIIHALMPHPDALRAVQGAFVQLEGMAET